MASPTTPAALQTCLVATDFSKTADLAIDWAIQIAKTHNAQLLIAHALAAPLPPEIGIDFIVPAPDLYVQQREHAEKRLAEILADVQKRGTKASSRLLQGYAAKQILELAENENASLIVIGTRGLTGWQHLVAGSVAAEVLRGAACPVLAVHPDSPVPQQPIRKILVPTDFSEDADLATHAAYQLLATQGKDTELVFLHAYDVPVEYAGFSGITVLSERTILDQVSEKLAQLAEKFRRNGVAVQTLVRRGYAPIAILEAAKQEKVDLIAMGTHGRGAIKRFLLGSTAERVLQRAQCPILTVHR